jgi:hypothetical protein
MAQHVAVVNSKTKTDYVDVWQCCANGRQYPKRCALSFPREDFAESQRRDAVREYGGHLIFVDLFGERLSQTLDVMTPPINTGRPSVEAVPGTVANHIEQVLPVANNAA